MSIVNKIGYNGNKNLKRSDVKLEFTKEQIQEYIKCSQDVEYFCENYVKIVHVDRGLVSFKPYEYQIEMFDAFDNNRFSICKMPRQVGKTTGVVGYLLHKILFNENYNIALLANKERQAREILSRIQLAYEWLPKWLQQGIIEWNKSNVELENGCKILASSTSSSAVRGQSFNLVYLDEFAFVPNNIQDQFFASVFPTISSGNTSKVIITSTPNGMNLFYKIWNDSEQGNNSWARVDVHWSAVPGRDEAWKDEMIRNTSPDQFRVEYECEFLGSANTLIHPSILSKMSFSRPISIQHDVKIYEEPIKGHIYACNVDVAEGVGGDYSAFTIVDITNIPYKLVAVYRSNNIHHLVYPNLIYNVATHFNNALVAVETNSIGQQIVDILHQDLEYEMVMMSQTNARKGTRVGGGFNRSSRLGIRTTKQVKRIGCANLKSIVENQKIVIPDYDVINELSTFVSRGSSYQAEEGRNDDLVMCLVLFSWMVAQQYFKEMTSADVRKMILEDNDRYIEDQMTPFLIEDGRDEWEVEHNVQSFYAN